MKATVYFFVALALALAAQWLLGRELAGKDVINDLIQERYTAAVLAAAFLGLRLTLLLVAPGWGLYVVVRWLSARRASPSASRGSGDAEDGAQ